MPMYMQLKRKKNLTKVLRVASEYFFLEVFGILTLSEKLQKKEPARQSFRNISQLLGVVISTCINIFTNISL